jgi:predicted RNA-binding Zn ribbon-like protein
MPSTVASPPPFQLVAGNAALDLVNTYDDRFRPGAEKELLATYDDLIRFAEQVGLLKPAEAHSMRKLDRIKQYRVLKAARELRETLAAVLYASLDGDPIPVAEMGRLREYFKAALIARTLTWKDSRAVWDWPENSADGRILVGKLAALASELLVSDSARKVRSCDSRDCRWLFLDTSKNHTRRWCDMKLCGNRIKARRYQAVHSFGEI